MDERRGEKNMNRIKEYVDDTGHLFTLREKPRRIISLVPSITELLFDLGIGEFVIGRTDYCKYPDHVELLPSVGGTKKININRILELKPDLIIGLKEEHTKSEIELLREYFPVCIYDVYKLEDVFNLIDNLSRLLEVNENGREIIMKIKEGVESLSNSYLGSVAYFIWRKPYMVVGNNTLIHDLLNHIGLKNVFEKTLRYPVVDGKEVAKKVQSLYFYLVNHFLLQISMLMNLITFVMILT